MLLLLVLVSKLLTLSPIIVIYYYTSIKSSIFNGLPVIGHVPVLSMCFSINLFSYMCPLTLDITGVSINSPDKAQVYQDYILWYLFIW